MRFIVSVLTLVFSVSIVAGQKVNKTLQVQPDGVVDIEVVKGEVIIEAWDKSEVKVEGQLDDDTEEFIFKTSGKQTLIHVKVDEDVFGRRNGGATELKIRIPENSSVDADGVSTDFIAREIKGGVNIESVSGNLHLSKVAKRIDLESVSGDIYVDKSEGEFNANTVSGDIIAEIQSEDIEVESVSGDIKVHSGKINRADMSAVSGDVVFSFELMPKGNVEVETVSGDIRLTFAGAVNARFNVETGPGGNIKDTLTDAKTSSSYIGNASMKGTVGDGSANVDVSTMSGTIVLGK